MIKHPIKTRVGPSAMRDGCFEKRPSVPFMLYATCPACGHECKDDLGEPTSGSALSYADTQTHIFGAYFCCQNCDEEFEALFRLVLRVEAIEERAE